MRLIDLGREYISVKKAVDRAVQNTIKSGSFILGINGKKLEEKVAGLVGTKYAVGLNSGTDALLLALKALGIGRGDEVITTPFSFVATAETIVIAGAKPVFVDIDPRTYNIDPTKIECAITKKTKAVIPVHLYGQMADMRVIQKIAKKYKLAVIEDAAQAIGASQMLDNPDTLKARSGPRPKRRGWLGAGSVGNVGCFSFFPTKNLGAYGDAGMITTNNEHLAQKIRMLRNHGSQKKYYHELLGYSSRLDELQAAILLAKLPHLKKWNEARNKIAAYYTQELFGVKELTTPFIENGNHHIFHQYTVRTKRRDELRAYLATHNIPSSIHYPLPLHLQPALQYFKHKTNDLPEAEQAAKEVLSLPLYPELNVKEQAKVVQAIKSFFQKTTRK